MTLDAVLARIDEDLPQALDRLIDLLRIPSISTDPAYKADCDRAADWLVADLAALGFTASKRPTPGHPMVVAHSEGTGPHLLFYGHYDVQPVDPLPLWHRPPFDAGHRGDPERPGHPRARRLRRQGAADDLHRGLPRLESRPRHPARPAHDLPRGRGGIRLALARSLPASRMRRN